MSYHGPCPVQTHMCGITNIRLPSFIHFQSPVQTQNHMWFYGTTLTPPLQALVPSVTPLQVCTLSGLGRVDFHCNVKLVILWMSRCYSSESATLAWSPSAPSCRRRSIFAGWSVTIASTRASCTVCSIAAVFTVHAYTCHKLSLIQALAGFAPAHFCYKCDWL